jgi:hypothetical protein
MHSARFIALPPPLALLLLPNFFHLHVQNKRWEAKDRGVCVVFQPKFGSEIFAVYWCFKKRTEDCFKFWANNSLANSSEKTDMQGNSSCCVVDTGGESGHSGGDIHTSYMRVTSLTTH